MNTDMTIERRMRTGPCRSILAVVLVMLISMVLLQASPAAAEEEAFPDRFMLRMGGYQIQDAKTLMRLDANDAPVGAYIDFKDTLGGDTRATLFRLDGLYRFNDRHSLGFSWYDVKFTGSRFLTKEIIWSGQTYSANAQVDSEIRFNVYKLNYQYSLFHNEKAELGASFGLHIMKVFAGISANGGSQSINEAVTAPLPVFGLFADYNFTPRFSAFYNYQFFFINYQDKVRGGLQDFLIGLEYRLFRNVALGAAYNRFGLAMDIKGDNTTLNLSTNWNGGMLYGSLYF
jgi:hypothetical protein